MRQVRSSVALPDQTQIRSLDATQLGGLSKTQLASLNTTDFAEFSSTQIGLLSGTRIADVVAVQPTTLLRLSKDDYERYLSQVAEVDHELERTAGRRAAEAARGLLDAQNKPE